MGELRADPTLKDISRAGGVAPAHPLEHLDSFNQGSLSLGRRQTPTPTTPLKPQDSVGFTFH